jgi:ribosomal protein S18 acetylase RimI-like enzyme
MTESLRTVSFRAASIADAALIGRHRRSMFAENGVAAALLDAMAQPFLTWVTARLSEGRYFGYLGEDGERVVAGIGMFVMDWPPHFLHPEHDQRGYVLNVYVDPAYRRRGLTLRMMDMAEQEFRRRGVRFEVLHASQMGRPVYERLGWTAMPEMAKSL